MRKLLFLIMVSFPIAISAQKTIEIVVADQTTIDGTLEIDGETLDEVVVTALNIERDKESLGHSVSQPLSSNPANIPLANVVHTPKRDTTGQISEDDLTVNSLTSTGMVLIDFTGKTQLILDEYIEFKDSGNLI
ncbi:hypothetical protein [Maribacter sp. 2304DJ31-5]|uniref:hypothetical protein n=1 Tax=Maribacter sp. 2304DJ31-5 TaxID=3386273 RepID=UPI0039BCF6EA